MNEPVLATRVIPCHTVGPMGRRAPYPAETRQRAIELAVEHGAAEAKRILATEGTEVTVEAIRTWMSRSGATLQRSETTAKATQAHVAGLTERRVRLADTLLELAEMSTDQARERISKASLRDLVGAWDYAIKNHQLLTGGATAREETADPHKLIDDLAEKRAQKQAA